MPPRPRLIAAAPAATGADAQTRWSHDAPFAGLDALDGVTTSNDDYRIWLYREGFDCGSLFGEWERWPATVSFPASSRDLPPLAPATLSITGDGLAIEAHFAAPARPDAAAAGLGLEHCR